jgi:aminodeoxyfutalosine synthase
MSDLLTFLVEKHPDKNREEWRIADKVLHNKRITTAEALYLYHKGDAGYLGMLANHIREAKNGKQVYFIRNVHLEPTNVCVCNCKFCSYSKKSDDKNAWRLSMKEITDTVISIDKDISEIHITGGTHPEATLDYYEKIVQTVKKIRPDIHLKAFSAAELQYVFDKAGVSYGDGFRVLITAGLDSIPGGGAEIFDEELRKKICPEKSTSEQWLAVHKAAHQSGIFSNATMLYGHLETYEHRVDHLNCLRTSQDETGKFNAFIPLKFRNQNNELSGLKETTLTEDMRNYAIARIFLDNFPHIKAYWPMLGKQQAQIALSFGVDDIDGTINNSTSIYTSAGMDESTLTVDELSKLITSAGYQPVERYSDYSVRSLGV